PICNQNFAYALVVFFVEAERCCFGQLLLKLDIANAGAVLRDQLKDQVFQIGVELTHGFFLNKNVAALQPKLCVLSATASSLRQPSPNSRVSSSDYWHQLIAG